MSLVLNKQKTLTEYKMEHEERCKYSYKKDNIFFCNITDGYKCPFNGRYHKMEHDIFGGKYINGQDQTGCEVCYAYNLGQDYEKFKQTKVVVPNDIDDDMKSEITNFFGEDKILQRN